MLVCLRYGIGDVVMELPAISMLRHTLPDAHITCLVNAPAHELLEGDPRVDDVVNASAWGFRHRWDEGDPGMRARVSAWVEQQGFDLVLDAGMAVKGISRAIWSLGIRSLESDAAVESAAVRAGENGVEAISAGVRAGWGLSAPRGRRPHVHVRARDHLEAETLLQELALAADRPFAVSPTGSQPLKQWPCDRFAMVADHAVETGAGPVLVLQGPQPSRGRAVVEAMRHGDAAIRVDAHHLLTTAALLTRCSGLVCNDTGIMHLAGAMGVPTVAVFGPTQADVFRPPRQSVWAVEPHDLTCPHRDTGSLHPPTCWGDGTCLVAARSCIHRSRTADVIRAVEHVLHGEVSRSMTELVQ